MQWSVLIYSNPAPILSVYISTVPFTNLFYVIYFYVHSTFSYMLYSWIFYSKLILFSWMRPPPLLPPLKIRKPGKCRIRFNLTGKLHNCGYISFLFCYWSHIILQYPCKKIKKISQYLIILYCTLCTSVADSFFGIGSEFSKYTP